MSKTPETAPTPLQGNIKELIFQKEPQPEYPPDTRGEFAFQVFCAAIFLGMIGLVFYNAFLRYVFSSSYPPSEEWARFLFIFITFFGAIEAFYRKKHIAVDIFVGLTHGALRKNIDIAASLLGLCALVLLLCGGIVLVEQTMDTWSVATGVNLGIINACLPIMAAAALVIRGRDLLVLIRTPASAFRKSEKEV
jgi:TRAP-type C4-dicarboxylate transport system permease small subunit